MISRKDETITAVNNYFQTLRDEKAKVTFATFDSTQSTRFRQEDVKASKLENLTEKTYSPDALTPLFDAIGAMIAIMDVRVKPDDKVLITIVTDGAENNSQEFSNEQIKELITAREKMGWKFTYIGATPAAWHGGGQLGLAKGVVLNVAGNQMVNAFRTQSEGTRMYFSDTGSDKDFYKTGRDLHESD
jgi:hypothetical protein